MKSLVLFVGVAVTLGSLAFLLAGGSPLRTGFAIAAALTPFAVYLAFTRPMIFPYAFYVILIPFDNLLNLSGAGTITKFLAVACVPVFIFFCIWRRKTVAPSKTLIPLMALMIWIALSAMWASSQQDALSEIPRYLGLALLYVAIAFTPIDLAEFRVILAAVAIGGIAAAMYGAHTYYNVPATADQPAARLIVTVGATQIDPNHFANVLLLPAALFIMFLLRTRWLTLKLLALGGLIVTVATILLTESREAFLGIAVIFAYYFWKTRRRLELLLVMVAGTAVGLFVQSPASIGARIADAFTSGGAGRSDLWRVGLEAFRHHWLIGSGIGTFSGVYDRYYLFVHQPFGNAGWSRPAHDLLVHYSVEIGIVGLALLLWFWFSHFDVLRFIKPDHPLYGYRVMLEASLIGLSTVALFIDLFTYKYAWLIFALMIQLRSVALRERAVLKTGARDETAPVKLRANPLRPASARGR